MKNTKYSLGLSSFSLMRSETIICTGVFQSSGDWPETKEMVIRENMFQRTHKSTSNVAVNEVIKRLKKAEEWELDFLTESEDIGDTSFICLLLVSRQYPLLLDITIDLLHYKIQGGDYSLEPYEINAWYTKLADTHTEIEEMKPSSYERLCKNTKLILQEGGLLAKKGDKVFRITKPYISPDLMSEYKRNGTRNDFRMMLRTEEEIDAIMENR
jgi:hypothetical protein